jgi:hypothetical protein
MNMNKTSIVSAVTALFVLGGVGFAQSPGITHEMIEVALPVEGAPLAVPGPYAVTSEKVFGSSGPLVFRPTTLDALPKKDTGHTATVFHPGGGEYANVASNWLMWTFKKDPKAGAMFVGKNCSLCTNANWDVQSKGITG